MSKRLQFALCIIAFVGFGARLPALEQQAESQQSDRGKQLYMANNCYLCHGSVGQGGAGPTLAPPKLGPENFFSAYVRHPTNEMPPYTPAVLSDADLGAIYGYLQSLPPPPQELPKLLSAGPASSGH
jgi:mono/diheme cytochrome c family protein